MTIGKDREYYNRSLNSLLNSDLSKGDLYIFYDIHKYKTKRMFIKIIKLFKDYDYVVIIQDDIIYNKNWLNALLDIAIKIENLGILTPWDRINHKINPENSDWIKRNPKINLSGKISNCKIGGICWLITKKFIDGLLKLNLNKYSGNCYDSCFQGYCHNLGLTIAATNPSYVEHIGIKSIVKLGKSRNSSGYRSKNFIGEM